MELVGNEAWVLLPCLAFPREKYAFDFREDGRLRYMKYDQNSASLHDGQRVREALLQVGMSQREFNRQMDWPARRVEYLLKKAHWTTGELVQAGRLLGYDFFAAYTAEIEQRLIQLIPLPVEVLVDPRLLQQLREEIVALADRIRQIPGD